MMRRRRFRFSKLSAFYFVVTLGIMVAGSMAMDRSPPVRATVTGKHEEIQISFAPQASWYRFYRVGVSFPTPESATGMATVSVAQERYDALRMGDTISVRPLPAFPLLARTADRTTMTVVRELGVRAARDEVLAPLLLWLVVGVLGLWIANRVSGVAIVVAGLGWIALGFPLFHPEPPEVTLPPGETSGRVTAIALVDRAPERRTNRGRYSWSSESIRRLRVPYQVVQLKVRPAGGGDSVLAVDAVDSGSVPGLAHDAVLPIRYETSSPRDGRLAQASRTFMTRNRYHLLVPMVGCGVLGMLGAWGVRDRRLRRARASALT